MTKLKCWRKVYDKNETIIWKNIEIGESVSIGKYYANSPYVGGSWRILPFGEKAYKHKSQALKLANSYMKRHDKC